MQRSPTLQPLSREHHSALRLAKICKRAAFSSDGAEVRRACLHAIQIYAGELQAHFLFEEQSLLPPLNGTPHQALAERTLAEHRQLRALLPGLNKNDAGALKNFGNCLAEHVRFEERELFPVLENSLARQII